MQHTWQEIAFHFQDNERFSDHRFEHFTKTVFLITTTTLRGKCQDKNYLRKV